MRHALFATPGLGTPSSLTTAILIKDSSFITTELNKHYILPLEAKGLNRNTMIAFNLEYAGLKKVSAAVKKEYLAELLPELTQLGITTLLVNDSEYFKSLTGMVKADPHFGYALPCTVTDYEHLQVVLGVNYQALAYNPNLSSKLEIALTALTTQVGGNYQAPGMDIITSASYPKSIEAIAVALDELHQYPILTCDIEAFGLKFFDCGIGSISFAWNDHEGIAFAVDSICIPGLVSHGRQDNQEVKQLLKQFFIAYQGILIWHNSSYDSKVLIYELWMNDLADYKGMLEGIEVMTRNFEDTKLIAYLATNNTVKNELSLKILAQPFAGNYAQEEIEDITKIPIPELLRYNLTDTVSTWYVYNKYLPRMIQDDQQDIYLTMFKPSVKLLLQVELAGMPIDPIKVQEARVLLEGIVKEHTDYLLASPIIKDFHYQQLCALVDAKTAKAKKKIYTLDDPTIARVTFNPGSDQQLQALIYDYLGYAVIDVTKSKAPATGMKTLAKLINHAKTEDHRLLFENLIGLAKADKILTSFIPAFERAQQLPDGSWRLYGNFNLGGTQSGRLSSSDPNMQNLPSGSAYAKIVKMCFISPKGWVFCGADFKALEAMGEALLSRDPNKLKIYEDGFDSHCLNTFAYFHEEMPDIINTVESINSIQTLYPKLRSKSKAPTFALQYQGTWRTIMKSAGLSAEVAKQVENNYHEFYKVSDAWIKDILDGAHVDGYVTGAFGLRIRTPILANTRISALKMPYAAMAERRSAGNAVTQSYGLLNNRAAVAFRERVDASPYKYDILLVSLIHDAIYVLTKDNARIIKWVNDNLIECMQWQELPELQHDVVKLGANLDLLWPDWSKTLTLDNVIPLATIKQQACEHKHKLLTAA